MADGATGEFVGEVLVARFRIVEQVGEGSMGQVYLAETIDRKRKEAVKVLHPRVAVDPKFVARFRREARAINRLQHRNIISLYDFGRLPDGRLFLSMEYAEGERLDHMLAEHGPMEPCDAIAVAHQLADALAHAHQRGVIHRDLKPSNVILTRDRHGKLVVKVLDFGMAKIISPDSDEELITMHGETFGTPKYMAPEQFDRPGSDPRLDIYAAGCIVFELLVGTPPFHGSSIELMFAHNQEAPDPPSRRQPNTRIAPSIDELVATCMAKSPDERYADGSAFLDAVERVARELRSHDHTQGYGNLAANLPGRLDEFEVTTSPRASSDMIDRWIATADTAILSRAELEEGMIQSMLELAEGLLDHGVRDPQLTGAIADLRGVCDEVSLTHKSIEDLDRRDGALEQFLRESESHLRFAIGELAFDRESAPADMRAEIERQSRVLEEQLDVLSERSEREQTALTDEAISHAAALDSLITRCRARSKHLAERVDAIIPVYDHDLSVAPLIDHYEGIRSLLGRLQADDDG